MNKSLNIKHLLTAGLITLTLPLALHAEPGWNGPDAGHDGGHEGSSQHWQHGERGEFGLGIPPHLRGLDLTEVQRDKLFNLFYTQLPTLREQGKLKHKAAEDLRTLARTEPFDDAKAQQLATQLAAADKELALGRARNEAKVFAILTLEQRQKLQDRRDERPHEAPVNFKGKGFERDHQRPRPTNS